MGDAVPTGFVVLPGSDLLQVSIDTVAVVCRSDSLGIEFADKGMHEVIALIDRSQVSEFSDTEFYAFADADDRVHIRWLPELPAGWRVLGKLLYTQLPLIGKQRAKGGFAELDEDFEF